MARRPARLGARIYREAVLADMKRTHDHFPTPYLRERIAHATAGGALTVSSGRLFRGLRTVAPELAETFSAVNLGREAVLWLAEDDTLTEQD